MRSFLLASFLLLLGSSGLAQQALTCDDAKVLEGPCGIQSIALKMNDLQAVGSHNSYKLAIPMVELARIRGYNSNSADSLDYSHLRLTDQLELGMRQLELDIVYDPEGGRFADPLLPRETARFYGAQPYDSADMLAPGFKVLHSPDIDVRSSCATWVTCLIEIRNWSQANPQHVPILIMFNAKEGGSAYPSARPALDFTVEAYAALDAETLSVFDRSELIVPDDVRGSVKTLREAVLAGGWPTLHEVRGKVFFAMDERPEKVAVYMRGRTSLEGLPIFVNSVSEEADHAAYFTINNPVRDQQRIRAAVEAGFIVRTRADADTREARSNSSERRESAFASGAQYVSTDYYVPRFEFSDYSVQLPGHAAARCNPVRQNEVCE